jgi:integrase
MADVINKLTDKECKSAMPTIREDGTIADTMLNDGGGLYLQVTASKSDPIKPARSWIFRYKIGNKVTRIGLGSLSSVSLSDARILAKAQRALIDAGKDPKAEKRRIKEALKADAEAQKEAARIEEAKAFTFEKCAKEYITAHREEWSNSLHAHQWESTVQFAISKIGRMPIADVDQDAVMSVLQPIWLTKTVTASRLRGRIAAILDYAKAKKLRAGDNPAAWGVLKHLLTNPSAITGQVTHQPALPYQHMPAFIVKLRKHDKMVAKLLEFTILTAVRRDEARLCRWCEFDLDAGLWTVPARRMKAKKGRRKDHRVPLSTTAIALLKSIKLDDAEDLDFVFPCRTGRPVNKDMPLRLAHEINAEITVHGFRSTFREWCGKPEKNGDSKPRVDYEVAEAFTSFTPSSRQPPQEGNGAQSSETRVWVLNEPISVIHDFRIRCFVRLKE